MTEAQELAARAIRIQQEIDRLTAELVPVKEQLREWADGKTQEILVAGLGKVSISVPYAGGEKKSWVVDEQRFKQDPDLLNRLVDDGIIKEHIKKISASAAKVTIKSNI